MYHQPLRNPNEQSWAQQRPLKPGQSLNNPDWLYLRIRTEHIGLYPSPPLYGFEANADLQVAQAYTAIPRDPNTTADLVTYLLQGELEDFLCFSRLENAQWLLNIAHDLCDPLVKRGSLWIMDDHSRTMQYVHPTSPLRAAIYEYRVLDGHVLRITKRLPPRARSISRSIGFGRMMRESLLNRDGNTCWITGSHRVVSSSHICPQRVGDAQARYIYETFTAMNAPPERTIYNPQFGILLSSRINHWFDKHHIGFKYVGNNQYQIHNFYNPRVPAPPGPVGAWPTVRELEPPLMNGWIISPPNPTSPNNPPPGLFRWHYLQCVIKRFRAAGYDSIEHIAMYENTPLREGDPENDRDGPDSDEDNNPGHWSLVGGHVGRAVASTEQPEFGRFAITAGPQLVTA
ncbi:hypothetical protein FB446DRAFT_206217 [Lentinula raphanica]|nr:hypothetical protein FB446DRAFT_206217 [Lentinula raphanica]